LTRIPALFPYTTLFRSYIICDAPISMGVFMEFEATKEHYKRLGVPITDDMTDQEVLDAISYWEENPPEPEPTAEERIAAMLEFQDRKSTRLNSSHVKIS